MSEPDGDVAKKIQEKRTRVQAKAAAHQKADKDRADNISNIRAAYQADRDGLIVKDILAKAKAFAAYHTKVAQDGVGARKTGFRLENGQEEVENIYFTNEKRVSELDRAAGLLELVDYIERQIEIKTPQLDPEIQQAADNAAADEADKPDTTA